MTKRKHCSVSNYPDDIHDYDNHPMSPFYVEPEYVCDECELAFEACDMAEKSQYQFCNDCWTKEDEE